MKIANRKVCPNCAKLIPAPCICENDPKSEYSIVSDDEEFGIAFKEEIKILGLNFETAKRILALLIRNQNQKDQDLDWWTRFNQNKL